MKLSSRSPLGVKKQDKKLQKFYTWRFTKCADLSNSASAEKNQRKAKRNAMNTGGTIIRAAKAGHVPPPLTGLEKKAVDEFYSRYGVTNKSAKEKIQALMKVIQARSFFAFGGGETPEMELRANERIYLSEHGKAI